MIYNLKSYKFTVRWSAMCCFK